MTIKKVIIILSTILLMSGLVYAGWFWVVVLSDPQSPEFSAARGIVTEEPTVEKSGDAYTITWSTTDNYPNNEVVMKSDASKYADAGVGADTNYDSENNVYVHTGQFRLADSKADSNMPVFALGNYTYQVESSGLNGKDPIISPVLELY